MKTYKNTFGFLAFSLNGKDYITNKGDTLELPSDDDYVKRLLLNKQIEEVTESVKPSKTQK